MSDLPSDLLEEIFSTVPTTSSLTRLRYTCKRWNALFKNRRFTARKAPKQSLVLMLMDSRIFSMSDSLKTLNFADSSIECKVPLGLENSHSNLEEVEIVEAFHCGGLLLCTTNQDRLMVWNPCLGEIRLIQTKTDNERFSRFVLGYENNKFCHSFKILRCYHQNNKTVGDEIYDFSSDSWRVLVDVVALDSFLVASSKVVKEEQL
ncbi:hypothetical protein EUTSA_v10003050mg [Eutrema salsugineum]|uniref:F-box domain-containing protein n=1 Tax=Eutrema salsugineum TaxID=72664 RepID=V4KHB8_EUTSA|nr:hypothetical protein EUTSA_v10003050mg [Eutrema salsugineum]